MNVVIETNETGASVLGIHSDPGADYLVAAIAAEGAVAGQGGFTAVDTDALLVFLPSNGSDDEDYSDDEDLPDEPDDETSSDSPDEPEDGRLPKDSGKLPRKFRGKGRHRDEDEDA